MPWEEAWATALYGAGGFYRQAGPAAHFTTATHGPTGPVLAAALLTLAAREGCRRVVDIGCGRGELLSALRELDPGIPLLGVDVVPRPDRLATDIGWTTSPGGAELPPGLSGLDDALVLAHEWLDVVPCTVAEVDDDGAWRVVLVASHSGRESLGAPLGGEDGEWVNTHWPGERLEPGDRAEVGRSRDEAWTGLLSRIGSGVAVAIDYGHLRDARPHAGTLTAYRGGTQTTPVPDGSCDLTAHVAMDTLEHDELHSQRDALRALGLSGTLPLRDQALTDPMGYLEALARSSAVAALTAPGGFGDFWWALKRVG